MAGQSCGQSEQDRLDAALLATPASVPEACVRCRAPPAFIQRGTAYCQNCFRQVLANRFARALEGAKTVSASGFGAYASPVPPPPPRKPDGPPPAPQGKVVVAFSGGVSSRAVLELLRTTFFSHLDPSFSSPSASPAGPPAPKKKGKKHGLAKAPAFADCEVVYVDESCASGEPDRTDEVRDIVTSSTPFRFTALRIEDVFDPAHSSSSSFPTEPVIASTSHASLPVINPSPSSASPSSSTSSSAPRPSPAAQLHSLLSPLSPSSRASLLSSLRLSLLTRYARKQRARVLVLGSSGTRLAVDMLAGMAQGRGWTAGEEVGAEWVSSSPRRGDGSGPGGGAGGEGDGDEGHVLVVRPLALVSLREARHLCESAALRHIDPPSPVIAASLPAAGDGAKDPVTKEKETSAKGRSIGALVEDFVFSLDASFPSTAQTVVRTAHKLGLRSALPPSPSSSSSPPQGRSQPLCALCGLPAQPAADEWRRAITISDLVGARAALARDADARAPHGASVSLPEGRGGVRAPYAPSAAHLVVGDGDEGEVAAGPAAASVPAAGGAPPAKTHEHEHEHEHLAPHLCYGCLLVLQEPGTAPLAKGRTRTEELVLPPFVRDGMRARREADLVGEEERRGRGEEQDVVGTREVHGVEAMRKEVEGFLLEDGDVA